MKRPPRTTRCSGTTRHSRRDLAFFGAAALVTAAAAYSAFASRSAPVDSGTDCLAEAAAPAVKVLAIDTTDPLLRGQTRTLHSVTRRLVEDLPQHGRLAVVEIRGGETAEIPPMLDRCVPRLNSNRARHRFARLVEEPLETRLAELEGRPAEDHSAVIETALAIGARPGWRDAAGRVNIILVTDGLQNTRNLSFYRTDDQNPLVGRPLDKVSVTIVPLRNERDLHRQAVAFERLASTLRGAGADVTYQRPAWLGFEETR